MASLIMNLNYGMVPYVPSLKVGEFERMSEQQEARSLLLEYNTDEPFVELIDVAFGEDKDASKQAIMDLVPYFVKKA